jgi:hypothetical protein
VEDLVELLLSEILRAHVGVETRFFDEEIGPRGADAVDVTEGIRDFLFRGNIYTEETWHVGFLVERRVMRVEGKGRLRSGSQRGAASALLTGEAA